MYPFSIGVILDSFQKSIPESLKIAASMGAKGIQVYSTYGELSPKKLTGAKRREFLDMVKDHGAGHLRAVRRPRTRLRRSGKRTPA